MMNAVSDKFPVEVKDEFSIPLRKRGFLRTVKNLNIPIKKYQASRVCHNCSHHLSRYYYWKQSPCDSCSRSPMFYYRFNRIDLPDHWVAATLNSDRWKNIVRLEITNKGLDISLEPNSPRHL